jgi:hypothetical protein
MKLNDIFQALLIVISITFAALAVFLAFICWSFT